MIDAIKTNSLDYDLRISPFCILLGPEIPKRYESKIVLIVKLQFQLDPSSFETWHGMYTITLESEDEVGIPGIFKVKKTDNFSGSLDSWAGWPYPYWQVLENSSYAARAKELQGMMLKTKGAEAPFHQWNLGKRSHGISCLDFWDLEDLTCFKFQAENISFQDWQMIRSLRMKVKSKSILTPASIFSSVPFCGAVFPSTSSGPGLRGGNWTLRGEWWQPWALFKAKMPGFMAAYVKIKPGRWGCVIFKASVEPSQHGRWVIFVGRSPARFSFAWMKPLGLVLLGAAGATYLLRKWETPGHVEPGSLVGWHKVWQTLEFAH